MALEFSSLFTENQQLQTENTGLKLLLTKERERIAFYEQETEHLKEIILGLKRERFGRKSERWESEEQIKLGIFNEAEACAKEPDADADADSGRETVEVKGFTRTRGKRKPLPGHLPRRIEVVELPEQERVDEDGTPLKVIGKEVSEKLTYEPAKFEVIEYHRLRYGRDAGDPVKTAPPVPQIIPKGIASASLLAGIVTHKYSDGLPLYRMEELFTRGNVELKRQSMGRWIVQAAEAAQPVWNVLEEKLIASDYVSCDETHTQVLKEKGRPAESQSWMWVRATPVDAQKIVLFDYDPHRSGEVAKRLLSECRGYLQVDGYDSYNAVVKESQDGLVRIGCNMHGRRGFEKAKREGSKGGHSLAEQGLRYYKTLYDREEEWKKKVLTPEERFRERNLHAAPIWDEMKAWATQNIEKVPPKSKIGQAFSYFLSEYEFLRGYLRDGRLEPDNGFAERAIRKFAIGRNNWMFSDTQDGAQASALFYSFVITAKINGVNPYLALRSLFEQLPLAKTIDDYERLANLLLSPA